MDTAEAFLKTVGANGVVYCHWKSNSHLEAGLEGKTDLDLLVDSRQIELFHELLAEGGFKRFVTHPSRAYSGMEDFLGVHPATGRLLHLHIQYRLLTGPPHLKNYRLPWEDLVLRTRIVDQKTGVFTSEPGHEWLLLVLRSAMKIRGRDRAMAAIGRNPVSPDLVTEHQWLASKSETRLPGQVAADLLGPEIARLVDACIEAQLGFAELVRLRRALKIQLSEQRTYGLLGAGVVRIRREVRWALGSLNRITLRRPFPYARVPASGGLVVAVIGGDGSGKSTITGQLYEWLAGKVDVMPVYFGSGKGKASLLRLPLNAVRSVTRRSMRTASQPGPSQKPIGFQRAVWALVLAREKRANIRRAIRASGRGFVVICDRYPQASVPGMIDGPLLSDWSTSDSRIKRALSRWEKGPYDFADDEGPDVVIRLDVTSATAAARRPEEDAGMLDIRRGVVENLPFKNARFGLHPVDAEQSLDTVLLGTKNIIWDCI